MWKKTLVFLVVAAAIEIGGRPVIGQEITLTTVVYNASTKTLHIGGTYTKGPYPKTVYDPVNPFFRVIFRSSTGDFANLWANLTLVPTGPGGGYVTYVGPIPPGTSIGPPNSELAAWPNWLVYQDRPRQYVPKRGATVTGTIAR